MLEGSSSTLVEDTASNSVTPSSSFIYDEELEEEEDKSKAQEPVAAVHWNVAQQKGYKYGNYNRVKSSLHPQIEDAYFPLKETSEHFFTSVWGDKVFFLADGHAGHEAPVFFITGLQKQILDILNKRKWFFGNVEDQTELMATLTEIYIALDEEYTLIKTQEYQQWVKNGNIPHQKPIDDGCTMVVNILQPGWVLNCNVGDSRTVIGRPSVYDSGGWVPCFSSDDHNMMNPFKVSSIHKNGGKFLDYTGTVFLNVRVEEPHERNNRAYRELGNSRLFRPMSDEVKAVGCSHRRTLNLSGTMGDLLFKIHPPVLTSAPDFNFVKLTPDSEHVIVMATDGLWDHLSINDSVAQNDLVVQMVSKTLSELFSASLDSESEKSYDSKVSEYPTSKSLTEKLSGICKFLVDREGGPEIFSKDLIRYDDATVMIIHIS